jgi:predicted nucleic acid-binding protein
MNAVFADTYFYIAVLSVDDAGHEQAIEFARTFIGQTVTTEWVMTEVADAFSSPNQRHSFLELLDQLRADPSVAIIAASHTLFDRGVELFARRGDKSWSLTDCISFVTMTDRGLRDALTADHHFEQAGFSALLARI